MSKPCIILGLEFESNKAMAEYFGIKEPFASDVVTGKREITSKMAKKAGYSRIKTTTYKYVLD